VETSQAPKLTTHKISVLLVDDQAMIGEVVRRQLAGEEGIGFHYCGDPTKALDTVAEVRPTVILQDLVMPGVDGLTLVRQYRENPATAEVPIIVLSTKEDPKVKAEAFALGASDYIVKLPDRVELVARIRHHSAGYIAALERNEAFESLKRTYNELKQTQAKLIMQEKMASLGNLVAGVAHEMNTPLGVLTSNNDVLLRTAVKLKELLGQEGEQADPQVRKKTLRLLDSVESLCRVNQTAADRMDKILTSLRSFARLDRAEEDRFDVREGLDSTLTLIAGKLGDRIRVIKQYEDVPQIRCFPSQVNQVFMNVLTNAIEAIEGEGEIRLRTFAADEHVTIEIADNGVGIPPENLNKIFDPGFTTKGVKVGTGLGLSIVQRIVEDHHGSVEVQSEVGKGTTVRIILPFGW